MKKTILFFFLYLSTAIGYSEPIKGTIFVVHHRPFWVYESSLFVPIQAGKQNSPFNLSMLGDDEGENISYKNPFYCEMTALYWAWKNRPIGDFVGFFHYRRYLNSSENPTPLQVSQSKVQPSEFIQEESIYELMKNYDMLLPTKHNFSPKNIAQQYCYGHPCSDWHNLIALLHQKHPEHHDAIQTVCNAQGGYMCNCFIMKDSLFEEYAEWVFSILFEMEKRITVAKEDALQKKVLGFLAERLINFFIEIKKKEGNLRIKELPYVYLNDF